MGNHGTLCCILCVLLEILCYRVRHCRKVVAESEQVFGPDVPLAGPLPSVEKLRGLQFTEACLRETLRKYRYYHRIIIHAISRIVLSGRWPAVGLPGWWLVSPALCSMLLVPHPRCKATTAVSLYLERKCFRYSSWNPESCCCPHPTQPFCSEDRRSKPSIPTSFVSRKKKEKYNTPKYVLYPPALLLNIVS